MTLLGENKIRHISDHVFPDEPEIIQERQLGPGDADIMPINSFSRSITHMNEFTGEVISTDDFVVPYMLTDEIDLKNALEYDPPYRIAGMTFAKNNAFYWIECKLNGEPVLRGFPFTKFKLHRPEEKLPKKKNRFSNIRNDQKDG